MFHRIKALIVGLFIILTISSFLTYWSKTTNNTFADEIISDASSAFKTSLVGFLSAIDVTIDQINSNVKKSNGDQFSQDNLNSFFSKMILADKYLNGVVLAHNDFLYIIYRDNTTWAISYDLNLNDTLVNWKRFNNKLEVVSEWTDAYNFFPNDKKLVDINRDLAKTKYLWRTSKSQMNDKGDLLTNIFETTNNNGERIIAGLIFSTLELSNNFVSVLKFEHPLVSIITSGGSIVTPMVTIDSAAVSRYNGLKPDIKSFIDSWNTSKSEVAQSFSFERFSQKYWTRIDKVNPSIGVKGFAVTISEADLAQNEKNMELIYLYVSFALLFVTLILIFILFRKKKDDIPNPKDENFIPLSKDEVQKMISGGETEYVEFKSSVRWDYREEKVNKVLEYVILKSIAAFANAKGGTLLIGVADNLEILGLEKDFSTLKKQDVDYFELHTRKLITNQYGIAFANENLLMEFPVFDGKAICSIQIKAASVPIFLKSKSKQGQEIEKFYVRSGNASQEIASLKEVNEYIKVRFR